MVEPILSDLSAPALARTISENLFAFFRFVGHSSLAEMEEGPGWLRWRTSIAHPWFNGVLCWRPPGEGDAGFVEHSLAFFRSRGVAAITWWCDPDLSPAAWGPYLQAHGFHFDDSTPGMALDLDKLPNRPAQAGAPLLPDGLEVAPVEDAAGLETWVEVFVEGYPIPAAWKADFLALMADLGLGFPLRNYLGVLNGAPVATSSVFLGAGVAGVMFVATLPAARGRGVGAAMTLAPLYQARDLGYRAGILQSSEIGYPVYRRMGFQHLIAMEHFYWQA